MAKQADICDLAKSPSCKKAVNDRKEANRFSELRRWEKMKKQEKRQPQVFQPCFPGIIEEGNKQIWNVFFFSKIKQRVEQFFWLCLPYFFLIMSANEGLFQPFSICCEFLSAQKQLKVSGTCLPKQMHFETVDCEAGGKTHFVGACTGWACACGWLWEKRCRPSRMFLIRLPEITSSSVTVCCRFPSASFILGCRTLSARGSDCLPFHSNPRCNTI